MVLNVNKRNDYHYYYYYYYLMGVLFLPSNPARFPPVSFFSRRWIFFWILPAARV